MEEPVLLPNETQLVPKPLQRCQGGVFECFISVGSLSQVGVTETENTVIVLRDIGVAQAVRLKNVLPLSDGTDIHKSVLAGCIRDTGYQSVPLQILCLKSKYVIGDFLERILQVNSWTCVQCPVLCEKPVINETFNVTVDESKFIPGCLVTRPMGKKAKWLQDDETVLQGDSDGDIMTLSETGYSD